MSYKYWRVVCKYGRVGRRNEVSVPRYIQTDDSCSLIDVIDIVSKMPGIKKSGDKMYGIVSAKPINEECYLKGKIEEKENLFLKKLMAFNIREEKQTVLI